MANDAYVLRALNDRDLLENIQVVGSWLEELRRKLVEHYEKWASKNLDVESLILLEDLHGSAPSALRQKFEYLRDISEDNTLLDWPSYKGTSDLRFGSAG